MWKNGITAFKFKATAKVQNVSECLDDIFWTKEHFVTKPGMVMQHHKPECHAENWFTVFSVKVTARAYISKILLFLLYLLNCWSVCNQIWFDSTASEAGVSYLKFWLLHSRSKSHRRLKMLVNVCLDNYLLNHRMICHQTWYGYAALWAKASCRKTGSLCSMSRSQQGLI